MSKMHIHKDTHTYINSYMYTVTQILLWVMRIGSGMARELALSSLFVEMEKRG